MVPGESENRTWNDNIYFMVKVQEIGVLSTLIAHGNPFLQCAALVLYVPLTHLHLENAEQSLLFSHMQSVLGAIFTNY